MRRFTWIGLPLITLLILSSCATVRDNEGVTLHIMHTNDTHSHFAGNKNNMACLYEKDCTGGMGLIAKLVREQRESDPQTLFLDAGDQFQGSLLYSANKTEFVSSIDALMGYNAGTLGNHEFDEGCETLAKYVQRSSFPLLAANLAPGPTCPLKNAKIEPYKIVTIHDKKVGIIGLSNPDVVNESSACKDTHFIDPIKALSNSVKELQDKGINIIVAVTHLGLPFDEKAAQEVNGIDIIVGGHSHDYIGPGSALGGYPIVKHSPDGNPVLIVTTPGSTTHLGSLEASFDSNGVLTTWQGQPIKLGKAGGTEGITKLIAQGNEKIQKASKTVVGKNLVNFTDGMEECRHGTCLAGASITKAMLDYSKKYGADFALLNSGAIRSALPQGNITAGDLLSVQPFNDVLDIRKYSGEQIITALERAVSDVDGIGPRLLQSTDLRYEYDAKAPVGKRILKVEVKGKNGKYAPINPNKIYTVALNTF